MATTEPTAVQLARALHIGPRTRAYVLRDEYGMPYGAGRSAHILAALSRADKTPDLPERVHTVAYAVWKSLTTARMAPGAALALQLDMRPYQVCALVATVARECPETTVGGICDGWLPKHIRRLTGTEPAN